MKFLSSLQKNALIWPFIIISTVFVLLRLPALVEPYWYGDEGIYEVIGQMMNHGSLLYRDAWDNKPPLLYLIYAFANGDQPTVKLLAILFGLATVITFSILTYRIFAKSKTTIFVSSLFALLFATPLIEGDIANAENFMLLFIISAGLLLYQFVIRTPNHGKQRDRLLFAGLLLGIGFLFKTVVLFDFIGFAFFLFLLQLQEKFSLKTLPKTISTYLISIFPFIIGFSTPFIITLISFASLHNLDAFIHAAFFGNVDYVGYQNAFFGIPQGLLILKILLLFIGTGILIWKHSSFSKTHLFVLTWLLLSLFNAFFSGRPYTHYVLVLLPSICLLIGLGLASQRRREKILYLGKSIIIIIAVACCFFFYPAKAFFYYPTVFAFLTGHMDVTSYQTFFDVKAPRDYAVAEFLRQHTKPSDNVYIWGDNAQIYTLANKLPPSKYLDSYHLVQNNVAVTETQKAIAKAKPKYIVTLDEAQPLPFNLPLYIMLVRIPGATIYERHL